MPVLFKSCHHSAHALLIDASDDGALDVLIVTQIPLDSLSLSLVLY